MKHEAELKNIIKKDPRLKRILPAVRELELPNWFIGGGAIRNTVWDKLHGIETPFNDIDVVYFDEDDVLREIEDFYEKRLAAELPYQFDVNNQARVHSWLYAGKVLISTEDGIASWTEKATCVGVRLEYDDTITISAPHKLDDLFDLIVRPGPVRNDLGLFRGRVAKKQWQANWPKLEILYV
tara:strand:- start:117 stop:662 length:546 start_codon:yes stop_codon:yes gene_type:complete